MQLCNKLHYKGDGPVRIPPRTRYLLPLLAWLLVAAPHAATGAAGGFSLYTHSFLDEDERRPAMKVTITVPYSNLVFLKKNGNFEAVYRLYIRILDKGKKVVDTAVVNQKVAVQTYDETRSSKQISRLSHTFFLQSGDYIVRCVLRVKDTHLAYSKETNANMPKLVDGGLGIGKPKLFSVDIDTTRSFLAFRRIQYEREFDMNEKQTTQFEELDKQPALVFDVYLEKSKSDSVECSFTYQVLDSEQSQVFYGRSVARLAGAGDQFVVSFDVGDWTPDDYVFHIRARLPKEKKVADTDFEFTVGASRVMLTKHFDKTLEILSLIGTDDEIEEMRDAPETERAKLWQGFWLRRDPSPGTQENEALDEHLRRVRYVDANFSEVGPGWRSDRGKVYIVHGEPDQTDVRVDPQFHGEYLVWRYFDENLEFVFYDRFGLGEYKLSRQNGL